MPLTNRLLLAAFTVAALTALPARAENKARSLEIGVTSTFIHFDSESDLDNDFGLSALAHYNFTTRHGAEINRTVSTSSPKSGPALQADFTATRLGYVYTASRQERLLPFFRVGFGWWNLDVPKNSGTPISRLQDDDRSILIYTGGGLRIRLTNFMGIRFSGIVDMLSGEGGSAHPDILGVGEAGVYFRFGGRDASEPPEEQKSDTPAEPPKEGGQTKPPLR